MPPDQVQDPDEPVSTVSVADHSKASPEPPKSLTPPVEEPTVPYEPLPPKPEPVQDHPQPSEAPPPTPAAKPGQKPGDTSEKESDAASIRKSVLIRPGHPAAAQGLEIVTRRPEFTRLTRVTAWPRNPIVRVTFDRTGKVTQAKILRSSGVEDVDNPVLYSVYQWTAKGKALAELPKGDVHAGVTITVTIILH